MKIYTKTGDRGTTSDLLGRRISKGDIKIELQGSIDEVNAGIGYLRALLKSVELPENSFDVDTALKNAQNTLFKIGSDVSSDFTSKYINDSDISVLEQSIDIMTDSVAPLQSFIYYSGCEAAAYSHVLRSITRRAERVFVRHMEGKEYNPDYQYINRLSDFFFALSRYINVLSNTPEEYMKL